MNVQNLQDFFDHLKSQWVLQIQPINLFHVMNKGITTYVICHRNRPTLHIRLYRAYNMRCFEADTKRAKKNYIYYYYYY